MLKEFKAFAMRGSVMDLAIGVIIGAAFGKIIASLVENILMPLIGIVTGGLDFSTLSLTIGKTQITYGLFLQNVFDFLIVAFVVFLMVRALNKMQKPATDAPVESKTCPFCISEIPIKATKCAHCTSEVA